MDGGAEPARAMPRCPHGGFVSDGAMASFSPATSDPAGSGTVRWSAAGAENPVWSAGAPGGPPLDPPRRRPAPPSLRPVGERAGHEVAQRLARGLVVEGHLM